MKPLIGITTKPLTDEKYGQSHEYVDAVLRAGGLPVLIPPAGNPAETFDRLDGLILSGGGDIDPVLYGGRPHESIYGKSKERDDFEIALARLAARSPKPCLPICRGIQVLNVALGGGLVEHIPDEFGNDIIHRDPEMKEGKVHAVDIIQDSLLHRALGTLRCDVVSWHHQSVRRPAPGLVVTATAADGVVEALELKGHRWLVAVQWHPEMSAASDPLQQNLFDSFVRASAAA